MGSCIRLRNSILTSCSFFSIRFLIVLRPMTNEPHLRDRVQKCVKPRKSKGSGFPSPRFSRCLAAWRPKRISRVFAGCNASPNLRNSLMQVMQESLRLMLMLEADNGVVRVTDDDHVAGRLAAPAVGPEIEHVVQVHVRENR